MMIMASARYYGLFDPNVNIVCLVMVSSQTVFIFFFGYIIRSQTWDLWKSGSELSAELKAQVDTSAFYQQQTIAILVNKEAASTIDFSSVAIAMIFFLLV